MPYPTTNIAGALPHPKKEYCTIPHGEKGEKKHKKNIKSAYCLVSHFFVGGLWFFLPSERDSGYDQFPDIGGALEAPL